MNIVRRLFFFAPTALVLTACNSTEPNAMHRVSVSAATSASSARTSAGFVADLVVGGEGGSVTISSAEIVLSRLKLGNNEACADNEADDSTDVDEPHDTAVAGSHEPDDDHDEDSTGEHDEDSTGDHHDGEGDHDDGCPPLKVGPVLVDLPLDGTTKVVLDAFVPAGTYTRLQARLHAVDADDAGAGDFLAAHPDLEGISVKVVGVFKGADGVGHDFTFTSPMNVVSSVNFDTPITVGAGTTNLTIDVDVSSWFTDATGAAIDPTNSANQHAIEKNIRRSPRALEDDEHDGDDDHEEHEAHP
jgi:hypothetical protein